MAIEVLHHASMSAHGSYIATHAEVAKADAYCIENT